MPNFVSVAVGFRLERTFTYVVPPAFREVVEVGMRVLVPFGHRTVTGYVLETRDEAGFSGTVKSVENVLDQRPTFTPHLMEFLRWTAGYYQVTLGELMRKALPPSMHAVEKVKVRVTETGRKVSSGNELLERLAGTRELSLKGALEMANRAEIDRLIEMGLIDLERRVEAGGPGGAYRKVIRILEYDEERLTGPRQQEIDQIVRLRGAVPFDELKGVCSSAASVVKKLEERGVVAVDLVREFKQVESGMTAPAQPEVLTGEQQHAIRICSDAIAGGKFAAYLLHGVTGSGKTEVYLQAIEECLRQNKTALVLVPEIALTPQLMAWFESRFEQKIAVLHSALSKRERYDQWCQAADGSLPIVLGARSALFAPLENLGLIVVDEEHEPSFKQDERPFYNARDLALVRGKMAGATVVLGSATPSLESFQNAKKGKIGLLELPNRATARPLPDVHVVDLRRSGFADEQRVLSKNLAEALKENLESGAQSILFLNRKGFAAFLLCEMCGAIPRCPHCAISLTFYRKANVLRCHYCQYAAPVMSKCDICDKGELKQVGFGTERVAESVSAVFPEARVEQLDATVSASKRLNRVLDRFRRQELDILIGTQIVAKGHDFPGVTLVGVLLADLGLAFPDFRAAERTFQLMTQVAGRAGRGDRPGMVFVQTYLPQHYALQFAQRHDFIGFASHELHERELRNYPPFSCISLVRVSGEDMQKVGDAARKAGSILQGLAGDGQVHVVGPVMAPLSYIRNRFRMQIMIRTPERSRMQAFLSRAGPRLWNELKVSKGVRWSVDVDPQNLM